MSAQKEPQLPELETIGNSASKNILIIMAIILLLILANTILLIPFTELHEFQQAFNKLFGGLLLFACIMLSIVTALEKPKE